MQLQVTQPGHSGDAHVRQYTDLHCGYNINMTLRLPSLGIVPLHPDLSAALAASSV